LIRKRLL